MTHSPLNESHTHQSPAGQRLDQRHREQLSALVDGELGADEARFLLRRMEHDPELSGCQERWQLMGDVMRGQASLLAPAGFSAAVAAAVAAEPSPATPAEPRRAVRRSGWRAWGGGVALAASVAAVALFMGGEKLNEANPGETLPLQVVASQAELAPAPEPAGVTEASADGAAMAVAAAPAVAMAASRRQDARRASATRSQQAARMAQRDEAPQRAVAAAQPLLTPSVPAGNARHLPFGDVGSLQARPWPKSSLAPAAGSALNASFPASSGGAAFYPFEPRLQEELPVSPRPRD